MKPLKTIGTLVPITLTVGSWLAWSALQNRVVITNGSGQPIAWLKVAVGGDSVTFKDIPTDGQVSAPFYPRGESGFFVTGRLEDGTQFNSAHGYVSGGMFGERAQFLINPRGRVDFKQTRTI